MASESSAEDQCVGKPDGYHSETSCVLYWLCRGGRTVLQRACSEGTLFNGLMCVPSALVPNCASQHKQQSTSIECTGLNNGLHRNFYTNSCSSYVICENENAVLKGKCKNNLIFDGNICIESNSSTICNFDNNNTEDDMECSKHRSSGVYASLNCQNYYYCNNLLGFKSQIYECPHGHTFSTQLQKCVAGTNCSDGAAVDLQEEPDLDLCFDKADGYYQDTLASGCRSYAFCSKGKKIIYLCPEGYAFDGTKCVVEGSFACPYWSQDCLGKPNGYHTDITTGCRQYFYCLNQNKVMTLTCSKSRIFDGSKCVPRLPNLCPGLSGAGMKNCEGKADGRHVVLASKCQNFITCHNNKQVAHGSCAEGFVFMNNDCVQKSDAVHCSEEQAADEGCAVDGAFTRKGCKDYYYCVNGHRTDLICPEGTVFNGYLCVDATSYVCHSSSTNNNNSSIVKM